MINDLQKKDYDKVIYDFNPNWHVEHEEIDLVMWFEQIVRKYPQRKAIGISNDTITYEQLDRKANYVAKVLAESGVEKEDLIGVIMDRSIEQIITILGILKSGAAFLPIDPENPEERISYIIQDSNVKQIITDIFLGEKYKKIVNKKIICPDFSRESGQKLTISYSPNQLAYVIYTSGTTGNPKGVMVEHKGLVNFIRWKLKTAKFDEDSVMLQKATCSFDAAVGEIFLGLLGGVKLQLLTDQENNNFSLLLDIIQKNQVTHMVMIPTVLSVLLDYAAEVEKQAYLSCLKILYIAGEKLEEPLVRKICRLTSLEKENIYNLYGPTEASIGSTYFHLAELGDQSSVSIGKGIDNAIIYIMNGNKICGVNESGELCIGGLGVARGYLNRPDLTKEKFVDNYFGLPGKIYRTGDLAKWQENGNLEYLGRIDEQVKINGLRIELSEIKNILADYPKIDDAAVIVSEKNQLIAYFVSKENYQETQLQKYLEKKLPLYMVPKRFVRIEVLPVNNNGKLDKSQLPAVEEELMIDSRVIIQPKTEKERVLISAFSSVLNNDNIGCNHNFFEVGGDSIKAIRIVSRLRESGYELSVPTIMAEKNISSIAPHIKSIQSEILEPTIVGVSPLSPIQKYFFDSNLPEPAYFNQTFLLECEELRAADFEAALAAVCNHHDLLRAVYKNGEQIIKEPDNPTIFELLMFDLADSEESFVFEQMKSISDQVQSTLNLAEGPLIKAVLFRTGQKDYISLIVHHLMVDGISWRILVEDINTAYRQLLEKKVIQLPLKTASFSRWCRTLEEFSKSEMLERERLYWDSISKQVNQSDAILCTPQDQQGTGYDEISLSEELTKNLIFHSNQSYNTEINDLLVTALFRTVRNLTNADTIGIRMEGHGREPIHTPIHIDRTIGWFTTIYPVVCTEIGRKLQEDIKKVKENLRRIPNHGLGYSVLNCYDETFAGVQTEITFNYLGDFEKEASDYNIQINTVEYGAQISENNHFGTPISIDGSLNNGIISFVFIYDKSQCSESLIKELKTVFEKELTTIVNHCLNKVGAEKTASDFGETAWDEEEFRKVEAAFTTRNAYIEKIYPLTPLQEGLLFHEQKAASASAYIVQSTYELGMIDLSLFKRALDLLVQKHSALRTDVIYKDVCIPRQVIRQFAVCDCEMIDLSEATAKEQELKRLEQEDVQGGFDFENDALFRVKLVKISQSSVKMIMTFHHIIMDGWCNSILLSDIKSFYDRLLAGESDKNIKAEFEPDYTHAEHVHYLENMDIRASKEYWKTLLEDYTTIADISPTTVTTVEAKENKVGQILDLHVTQQIRSLAKELNVTVNTVFESAWGILLQNYTNTEDVVFGQVVSGRNSPISNIEDKVGLFINTIPVRVKNAKDETFATIAANLQEQLNQSGNYDLYPLSEIQNENKLGNKLIQTIVAFENYEDASQAGIQAPLFTLERIREETNYDLTLSIQEGETFAISLLFDSKKYSEQGAMHILTHFCQMLKSVAAAPQQQISTCDFLTAEQRIQIEKGFNQTKEDFPDKKSVIDLFNSILPMHQKQAAMSSEGITVSYEQLDRLSTNLAYNLKAVGIIKGDLVAVVADRKVETIIFFLGILKAGAAYLPIDVNNPLERTAFILDAAKCKVICDPSQQINDQQLVENYKVITPDAFDEGTTKGELPQIDAEDLAYVIYTSGTTGVPKGVMITHKNILRLVKNTNYVEFNDSRILQTGSLTFDACTFEIWGALLNGGELFMTTTNVLLDPERLEEVIQMNKINTLFITTALFVNIVELYPKAFSTLKRILVGGEKIVSAPIKRFKKFNPSVSICNIYGPTENTTFSLFEELDYEIETIVPIGKPISNTTAYVMKDGRLCGIGIPGELYLGGAGVAAGYLNLKESTDEKFVISESNERLYKTGDLVRWLENGSIDYLGRIDDQVKIRGFRIELEGITTVIKQFPYVSNAITIIFEENGQKEICSYVQFEGAADIELVRHDLIVKLPHYMVPKVIMNMEKFKLNKNGKIDKSVLPAPEKIEEPGFAAARNETERIVCDTFSDILAFDKVGVKDDFFALGGHSLKVMQLSTKLAAVTGIKLSLEEIMTARTVEKIAQKLQLGEAYQPIEKGNSLVASSAQNRILLVEEAVTNSTTYNIPVVLMIEGSYSLDTLKHSMKLLSEKYEVLRTSFIFKDGNYFQTIADEAAIPISVSTIKKDTLNQAVFDFIQPFDLAEGPLLRGHVFTFSPNEHALVVDFHHTIFDGESIPIFVNELTALYNGEQGRDIKIQYKDYSSWKNQLDLQQQENFWLNKLADAELNTEFPTDFVRGSDANFIGNSVSITLPASVKEQIQDFGKKHGITNYIFYTAIFDLLLSKYTRKEEIIIGTAISGRNHPDLENMLGMFVNTVVLKQEIDSERSFAAFVKDVQANFFDVFKNQDYPFEKLVEKLGIQSSQTRNPIFDIMFSYEKLEDQEYLLDNAVLRHYELPNTTAKFDLTLTVKEHPEKVLLNFDYDFKLYKEETMKKALEHFVMLLTHVLEESNRSLSELSMINPVEEKKLCHTFNTQSLTLLQHETAGSWFEENVKKYPDRIAVGIGDKEVTYAELNQMANGVAKKLKESGVRRQDVVGLLFHRSIEFVASIYGVLKVGAAYLPIDVELPNKRIEYILENSHTKVILTNEEVQRSNLKTILVSAEDRIEENLPLDGTAEDCAYIIYTSGSTGHPKGVEIKHSSLINLIEWQKEQGNITDHSVVLQKATCSFDASVWEIFLATLSGVKLQMISEEENQDYAKLLQIIQEKQVTHTLMVPTVFDSILDYMKAENLTDAFDGLEKIYLGAEALTVKLLEKYAEVTNGKQNLTKITNLYGPTETTVCATFHEVSQEDLADRIAIGKPVRNTQVYIMNEGRLCGIDVAGEICVGGMGVFKQYSGSERLTEERMLQSTINEGQLLYRTGDLGKVDQYGRIHYLGRIDKQIKIRGFRIEIEEIEKELLKLPTISNAAVIVNESLGSPQICAYLISDTQIDISKISAALKDVFPDYMIPTFMKQIEELPANHNGKLDEKALQAIPIEYNTAIVPPKTKDEAKLLPLFKEVLNIEDIGVTDNFFELGGYSLKAVELSRRIEQEFSLRVSLKDIMKEQNVENIAKIIKKKNKKVFKPLLKAAEECLDE
ncbi:amino acid adenylation domain-containing protein [Enterococcus sp. BWT-B8]|uniref:non-ribosomal peptide synthetase n=1 Tax=Enterococcus sp. BWT-B8 TaxID=2885157 RepID=UPI001E59F4C9|nr:non-ribosomal peptide synthetase [Enterococcus sp. BWT-B8]MCB5951768.1 amino acid adenylation domain-containing protein [Enterococcus sp. BWT-B8]